MRQDPKTLLQGDITDFTLTFRPEQEGNYLARAYFEYGSKRTPTQEKRFEVRQPEIKKQAVKKGLFAALAFFCLIFLIAIPTILIKIIKRRRFLSETKAQSTAQSTGDAQQTQTLKENSNGFPNTNADNINNDVNNKQN